ncbi:uncharacterized protein [Palaemon carinicauda]|uniref:uncharacterized protein n=1 Tax=Palaemon carinicauda TaxID=392227 RepID=UPI0035B59D9E
MSIYKEFLEKLQHLENNLQELHHEMGHVKGLIRETGQCLKGEDLQHLTNVSAEANQEIKSYHEEMSEVISLSRKDECSEESLVCGSFGICKNTLFSFTCSCPSGFTLDGSECKDVDECAEGKDDCVANATCKNSIGSYSCSCNKHFEGDGRTSCVIWVGVYDGKWTSDGSLVPEDLWVEGYRTDPSSRCGLTVWDSSYKLNHWNCSEDHWGHCQFQMP